MTRKHLKLIILIFVILIFLTLFGQALAIRVDYGRIIEMIKNLGVLGAVLFVILLALTIIISPLTSIPFWVGAVYLYNFWPALILLLLGHYLGASTNFGIARIWGRPAVKKLIGEKGLVKVDEFTNIAGWQTLFLLRLLVGVSFDYASYAIGLTPMSFLTFLIVTIIGTFPGTALSLYLLDKAVQINPWLLVLFWAVGFTLAAVVGRTLYIFKIREYRTLKRENQSTPRVV